MYPIFFRLPEWLPFMGGEPITSFGVFMFLSFLTAGALLRPEMLAQVRFFGRASEDASAPEAASVVMIPARLVTAGSVWVVGAGSEAVRRTVELGSTHGDLVEVRAGLNLTDKLIDGGRDGLDEGDRVRIGGQQR